MPVGRLSAMRPMSLAPAVLSFSGSFALWRSLRRPRAGTSRHPPPTQAAPSDACGAYHPGICCGGPKQG